MNTLSVYDTSYQFVNNNLFIHRYTYVITGVNQLGEGISNNDTFSYQSGTIYLTHYVYYIFIVPRAVQNTSLDIFSYTQDMVILHFYFPVCYMLLLL